ncbi:hypothetical protein Pmani_003752 [Petrolisthes manimaculis]|uniref:Uncharacterized protein n=1 Tax=Petrolisthes manimaculis TaxID=1843537 RepID=A0AAE1QF11_9EUCA|nr:hypothetical protein Pmani_003752 [Petrolisthes manimaculis]
MSSVVPSFLALALSLVPLLLAFVVGVNTIAMTGARDSRQTFQKVVTCYYSNWAYWRSVVLRSWDHRLSTSAGDASL